MRGRLRRLLAETDALLTHAMPAVAEVKRREEDDFGISRREEEPKGQDAREAEDEEEEEDAAPAWFILVRGFPKSWEERQMRLVFAVYGGVAVVNILDRPSGRVAYVKLKEPQNTAKAVEQLHESQVGDGDLIEKCTISCELFGGLGGGGGGGHREEEPPVSAHRSSPSSASSRRSRGAGGGCLGRDSARGDAAPAPPPGVFASPGRGAPEAVWRGGGGGTSRMSSSPAPARGSRRMGSSGDPDDGRGSRAFSQSPSPRGGGSGSLRRSGGGRLAADGRPHRGARRAHVAPTPPPHHMAASFPHGDRGSSSSHPPRPQPPRGAPPRGSSRRGRSGGGGGASSGPSPVDGGGRGGSRASRIDDPDGRLAPAVAAIEEQFQRARSSARGRHFSDAYRRYVGGLQRLVRLGEENPGVASLKSMLETRLAEAERVKEQLEAEGHDAGGASGGGGGSLGTGGGGAAGSGGGASSSSLLRSLGGAGGASAGGMRDGRCEADEAPLLHGGGGCGGTAAATSRSRGSRCRSRSRGGGGAPRGHHHGRGIGFVPSAVGLRSRSRSRRAGAGDRRLVLRPRRSVELRANQRRPA